MYYNYDSRLEAFCEVKHFFETMDYLLKHESNFYHILNSAYKPGHLDFFMKKVNKYLEMEKL